MEPTPIPNPIPSEVPPIPPKPEEGEEGSHLKQIRTFEGDVADAIKKQNESLISIQRAEEKKREALKKLGGVDVGSSSSSGVWKPLLMSLLTIIFILGGGFGAYYAWKTYGAKTALSPVEIPPNQFVGASISKEIDTSTLGRQAIIDIVTEARSRERDANALEQIQLKRASGETLELLPTSALLTRLASHAPNPLVRSFDDLFMLGVLGSNPAHTVMLIKLKSFENAFPGMLEWEPRIIDDLLPLFADSAVLERVPSYSEFEDKTIQNQDTRILKSLDGETVLIYGFFDNNIVIITDNEESFRTVVNRLQSQKLSR